MFRTLLISLPAVFVLALIPARASTAQYNLAVDQCTGICGPSGPIFGTVTLTDTVANVVRVKSGLAFDYKFGGDTSLPVTVAWNLADNPTVFENDLPSGWSLLSSTAGSLPMTAKDGFEYGLASSAKKDSFPNANGPLNFTLPGAGLSTSSFEGASSDHFVAVDIYNAATCAPDGGHTGVVETTAPQFGIADAPEPGSVVLFGCGLVMFAWMLWKRAQRQLRRG
jgi:hypothetical protein